MNNTKNILFVCTGNTCRSPMAEALFNKLANDKEISVKASSAGIMAFEGSGAAENAIAVLADKGIDLTKHHARLINEEILEEVDLILAMEDAHLCSIPGKYRDKAHLLSRYASEADEDIFDPVGGDLEAYKTCADLLKKHLTNLIDRLE